MADLMLEVAAQFAMTPAARARIANGGFSQPNGPSKWAGLIGGIDDEPA
jgi:hypothetical protein